MMKLDKFRVTHFRSIIDSGWIDCDDVTTLVGINESGKSNVLLALWKLNPARGGQIDPLHDLPVTELSAYEKKLEQVSFIEAIFTIDESAKALSDEFGIEFATDDEFCLNRWYNGEYTWSFANEARQMAVENLYKAYTDEDGNEQDARFTEEAVFDALIAKVPTFVYYSNYGNLASKIYLPHAIKWLKNETINGIPIGNGIREHTISRNYLRKCLLSRVFVLGGKKEITQPLYQKLRDYVANGSAFDTIWQKLNHLARG